MAVSLPNGSTIEISSGFGSAKTVSAITNANPGVASSTAHGYTDGDYVVMSSGWSRLTDRVVRVDGATTNDFQLEGIDTTSTTRFPAGSGAGNAREVTGWTQIAQVLTTESEGGEQQFTNYQFLEADSEVRIPTVKAAAGLRISIADDPTLAGYIAASAANDDREPRAVRVNLANGGVILYYAYVTVNKTPTLSVNNVMACQVTLSFLNSEPVRYAA